MILPNTCTCFLKATRFLLPGLQIIVDHSVFYYNRPIVFKCIIYTYVCILLFLYLKKKEKHNFKTYMHAHNTYLSLIFYTFYSFPLFFLAILVCNASLYSYCIKCTCNTFLCSHIVCLIDIYFRFSGISFQLNAFSQSCFSDIDFCYRLNFNSLLANLTLHRYSITTNLKCRLCFYRDSIFPIFFQPKVDRTMPLMFDYSVFLIQLPFVIPSLISYI